MAERAPTRKASKGPRVEEKAQRIDAQERGEPGSAEGATAPTPPDRVRTAHDSDAPSRVDTLGFRPYVAAAADFLANPRTSPPLTLSVEGTWGSGKSSFMLQLRDVLRGRGHFVTEFNPWRHDKDENLWAAFAQDFVADLEAQMDAREAKRARRRLWRARFDWAAGWKDYVLYWATWTGLAAGVALVAALLLTRGAAAVEGLAADLDAGGLWGTLAAFLVRLSPWAALLVAAAAGVAAVRKVVGSPFEVDLARHVRAPDYEARRGFLTEFHEDFAKILDAYVGAVPSDAERADGARPPRVFVLVEDLDRCEAGRAAELMQAINLMLAEDPRLVFVLGMDREKVAAGIAVKHEKILPFLAAGAGGGDPARRGLEFGDAYLEKFIQVPLVVPQPTDETLAVFLRAPPRGARARPAGEGAAFDEGAAPTPEQARARAALQRKLEEREDEGDEETARVPEIALMVAPLLDRNPRRLKQFLNVFRLRAHIALQTGQLDPRPGREEAPMTLEQLGKFTAITLRWPKFAEDLDADRALLARLTTLARGEALADGERTPAVVLWSTRRPLLDLLAFGLDGLDAARFDLSAVAPARLLRVAPKTPAREEPRDEAPRRVVPAAPPPPPPREGGVVLVGRPDDFPAIEALARSLEAAGVPSGFASQREYVARREEFLQKFGVVVLCVGSFLSFSLRLEELAREARDAGVAFGVVYLPGVDHSLQQPPAAARFLLKLTSLDDPTFAPTVRGALAAGVPKA